MKWLFLGLILCLHFQIFAEEDNKEVPPAHLNLGEQLHLDQVTRDAVNILNTASKENSSKTCPKDQSAPLKVDEKKSYFKDLNKYIMLMIDRREEFYNEKIDDIVKNPGKLDESVIKKAQDIPENLYAQIQMASFRNFMKNGQVSNNLDPRMNFTHDEMNDMKGILYKSTQDMFSSRELLNIKLVTLSRLGILPNDGYSFERFKEGLFKFDGWILLGVLGEQLSSNHLGLPIRGQLYDVKGSSIKASWYVNLSDIGVQWRPKVEAGLKLVEESTVAAKIGVEKKTQPREGETAYSFKTTLDFKPIEISSLGTGIATSIGFQRDLVRKNEPTTEEKKMGYFKTSITNPILIGENYRLGADLTLGTNFKGESSQALNVNIENLKKSLKLSIFAENSKSKIAPNGGGFAVGIVFTARFNWKDLGKLFR